MLLRLLIATLFATALSACGGSSDSGSSSAAEVSGVFQAGGAQGVHYSTPTRSGSTDSAGTFKYLPGETVSFSIGAIQLGSAPGAASITVFTLSGSTPPTTELALRRELDRARRIATPFVRAVNTQWLMLALDADHDPANGLDLRNAETVLAGATIDLDQKMVPFSARLMKLASGLTLHVRPWKAVAEAYRGIGVTVAVHARTANRSTLLGVPQVTNTFSTYGAGGVRATYGTDVGDDGTAESSQAWTYDSLGRAKTQSVHMDASVFPYAVNSDTTWHFDARGAVIASDYSADNDADGSVDSILKQTYQNDTYGFPTQVSAHEYAGDGITLLSSDEQRSVYDARHNQTSSAVDTDANADGVIDARWTQTNSVDASDRYTGSVGEDDYDADGTIDHRMLTTTDYTGPSGTITTVTEDDGNADGVIDWRYKSTSRYDSDGFLLWQDLESDNDADGSPDYVTHLENTYDAQHRVVTQQSTTDFEADGVIDARTTRTATYDSAGNVLTSQTTFSRDDFVGAAYEIDEQRVYGASGEFLSSQTTTDMVSMPSLPGSSVATQVEVADGVLLLAQDYFESMDVAYVSTY